MYTWWLQQAWNFKLYTRVFHHSLDIKRSTNWALCWSLVTQFLWHILNAPSRSSTIVITLHIMEKFNINYSKKNIPTASIAQYKLMLSSRQFIKRMRWDVLEFLGKLDSNSNKNETHRFKSLKCPPQLKKCRNSKMIYCYY